MGRSEYFLRLKRYELFDYILFLARRNDWEASYKSRRPLREWHFNNIPAATSKSVSSILKNYFGIRRTQIIFNSVHKHLNFIKILVFENIHTYLATFTFQI